MRVSRSFLPALATAVLVTVSLAGCSPSHPSTSSQAAASHTVVAKTKAAKPAVDTTSAVTYTTGTGTLTSTVVTLGSGSPALTPTTQTLAIDPSFHPQRVKGGNYVVSLVGSNRSAQIVFIAGLKKGTQTITAGDKTFQGNGSIVSEITVASGDVAGKSFPIAMAFGPNGSNATGPCTVHVTDSGTSLAGTINCPAVNDSNFGTVYAVEGSFTLSE